MFLCPTPEYLREQPTDCDRGGKLDSCWSGATVLLAVNYFRLINIII